MENNTVSYCICVHNESAELDLLLTHLVPFLGKDDEIVIQGDEGNVTEKVFAVIEKFASEVKYIEFPLNKNFAKFKNNAIKNCSKDYIFLLDPDEMPHHHLIQNFKELVSEYSDIDLFRLPRLNIVQGITPEYIQSQHWQTSKVFIPSNDEASMFILSQYGILSDSKNFAVETINFPDRQSRIFKNNGILYDESRSVHELLTNFSIVAELPHVLANEVVLWWTIFHIKQFDRQVKQNNFYSTF